MAFNNSLTERLDQLRSRNQNNRMHSENSTGQNTPFRYSGSFMTSQAPTPTETPNLQRRFTTDLSKMQQLAPIGQQPNQTLGGLDMSATTFTRPTLLEKKRQEYESISEQKKMMEAQMNILNQKADREKEELDHMTRELHRAGLNPGYQSEPTTPPERYDQNLSSVFSRSNRYSSSSLTSPPGINTRSSRSGSQLTSPPSELAQTLHSHISSDTLPSKSVPSSRRGSNDRVTAYVPETNGAARRNAAAANRYSMPVTGLRSRNHDSVPENSASMGLGFVNTSFLFDEDENSKESATSPDVKSYLGMDSDKFPILVRRDEHSGVLSASSAALDLALSQSPGPEAQLHNLNPLARHRLSLQPGFSQTATQSLMNGQMKHGPSSGSQPKSPGSVDNTRQTNRHSMDPSLVSYAQSNVSSQSLSSDASRPSLSNVHASYSTSDVPTLKNPSGLTTNTTPPKSQAQHFHNHNASLGRIPPNAVSNRHSRELSGGDARREEQANGFHQVGSVLQASAAPFGPASATPLPVEPTPGYIVPFNNGMTFANQQYYGGYGVQLMNMGISPLQMGSPMAFQNQMQILQSSNGFAPYSNYANQGRFQDSQARIIQQRRMQSGDEHARFNNVKLEALQGEILGLCKDQHGCRYLQKKLEERIPENVHIIFIETYQHVVELMTDPFGNYLCQKLLEFSNDEQRTMLINSAAPEMVKIALNSHGTRALQKMIEFITTPEQIQTIIQALDHRVVELIQDLNGNHVIQKCLNRLSTEDAEFIFTAVGDNCVAVGTHRHGCCVLQRCIDHASGFQKADLIRKITDHAFHLVQDPFGNYVLQYIVDLQESCFTDPLCHTFQGQIPQLSKQKFSSNVIEKCLRGAQTEVTRTMIEEMLNAKELEKMLRDSYANYVVQTAMDYADPETKSHLVEAIRPLLPAVRQTPHGRRIQSKILALDGQGHFSGSGTPNDRSSGQIPLPIQMTSSPVTNPYTAPASAYNPNNGHLASQFRPTYSQYTPSPGHAATLSNGSCNFSPYAVENPQHHVQQPAPFTRLPQVNGGFF